MPNYVVRSLRPITGFVSEIEADTDEDAIFKAHSEWDTSEEFIVVEIECEGESYETMSRVVTSIVSLIRRKGGVNRPPRPEQIEKVKEATFKLWKDAARRLDFDLEADGYEPWVNHPRLKAESFDGRRKSRVYQTEV
jgi:hypothetical protein